jgi:methylated-DNA-[protein]-cysteine S-methyltransferase
MIALARATIETPIGDMYALASPTGLCALEFDGRRRHHRLEARLRRWFPPHTIADEDSEILRATRRWLRRYFDGESAELDGLPIEMHGAPFEQRVWRALLEIPAGETRSYGSIARSIANIGAARAVGLANGSNPIAIVVPCHRVIGSSGQLVGYGGGLTRKTWLLDHERRWRSDALF